MIVSQFGMDVGGRSGRCQNGEWRFWGKVLATAERVEFSWYDQTSPSIDCAPQIPDFDTGESVGVETKRNIEAGRDHEFAASIYVAGLAADLNDGQFILFDSRETGSPVKARRDHELSAPINIAILAVRLDDS
jgi:hypothetical protein